MSHFCWSPIERCLQFGVRFLDSQRDALIWHKDLTQHTFGDFSIAVVQANQSLEDQSQVKTGPFGTFFGIYDGHGGPEAARYITSHLFSKIDGFARERGDMSTEVLREAFKVTEEEFVGLVDRNWHSKPRIASVGSCCLVGVIYKNTLYLANLGDSRVVLGSANDGKIEAVRLSEEHNAANAEVRKELKAQHPDDSHIVVLKHGVWRVKGIIQVSRSIGDVYLKKPEVIRDPQFSHFGHTVSLKEPVLSAEPAVLERKLENEDRFLIFASDGLWEHLTDQKVVDLVENKPRNGIAKKLVQTALQEAANKREMRYSDLTKIEAGVRRYFHDDISVVVIYLDNNLMSASKGREKQKVRSLSMSSISSPMDIHSSHILQNWSLI